MTLPRLAHGRRRRLLLRLAINGVLQALTVVAITHLIRASVDAPHEAGFPGPALRLALVGLLSAATMAALRWLERVDAEALAQSYVFRVRTRLLAKLGALEPAALQGSRHGGLLLRFAGDLTALSQWVGRGVARLVVSGIVVAVLVTTVARFHWWLAVTLAAALGLAAMAACLRASRLDVAVRALRSARARLVTGINRALNGLATLDASGMLRRETGRLERRARAVRTAAVARAREVAAVEAIAEAGAFAIPIAVVCTALAAREGGAVTQGEVIAVLGVALIIGGPVRDLGRVFDHWRRMRIARDKILEFLALPERKEPIVLQDTGAGAAS